MFFNRVLWSRPAPLSNTAVVAWTTHKNNTVPPPLLNPSAMFVTQDMQGRGAGLSLGGLPDASMVMWPRWPLSLKKGLVWEKKRRFVEWLISPPAAGWREHCVSITWPNWAAITKLSSGFQAQVCPRLSPLGFLLPFTEPAHSFHTTRALSSSPSPDTPDAYVRADLSGYSDFSRHSDREIILARKCCKWRLYAFVLLILLRLCHAVEPASLWLVTD